MTELRILTMWEPWATATALGLKKVETRSWGTKYRGDIAIHAARTPVDFRALSVIRRQGGDALLLPSGKLGYRLGCILTIVRVADCLQMVEPEVGQRYRTDTPLLPGLVLPESILPEPGPTEISIDSVTPLERSLGLWQAERWAWMLADNRPLKEPIEWRGSQGLRRLENVTVLKAIAQQMPALAGRQA